MSSISRDEANAAAVAAAAANNKNNLTSAGTGTTTTPIMIYKGTGKTLSGNLAKIEAKNPWPMQSGQKRPSVRGIWGAGKGKGEAKCVPYHSLEGTVYVELGPSIAKAPTIALLVQSGGPGQRGQNGCTYNLGFHIDGTAVAGEECQHDPKVRGGKIPGVIKGVNIGPLEKRTLGIKWILTHPNKDTVHLEGWVDKNNDGKWIQFYSFDNPHGGKDIPVITKVPMFGNDNCQELRFRADSFWPVKFLADKSFIAELEDNPQKIYEQDPKLSSYTLVISTSEPEKMQTHNPLNEDDCDCFALEPVIEDEEDDEEAPAPAPPIITDVTPVS
jgi:hypothetical protein